MQDFKLRWGVLTQLKGAADVGAGGQAGPGLRQIRDFHSTQLGGRFGLHQVVDPGTAAADPCIQGFFEGEMGDGPQELSGLGLDPLPVDHVAGVMEGHRQRSLGTGG